MTATVTLTVNAAAPSSLTYSSNPATYTQGAAITSNTPSNSGGAVVSWQTRLINLMDDMRSDGDLQPVEAFLGHKLPEVGHGR